MSNLEKRSSQRVNLKAPIKVEFPTGSVLLSETYDISDNGLYVHLSPDQIGQFTRGSVVRVQFQDLNYTAPVITAEVVRNDSNGVGLMILQTYTTGDASEVFHNDQNKVG